MTPARPLWLRLVSVERGALLWMPGLWAAAALVLFAMVQASVEGTFFNYTRELRVALGPVQRQSVSPEVVDAFTLTLRRGLAARRELTMVGSEVVERRAQAMLGSPLPDDPQRWMRATRNLNLSAYVTVRLQEAEGGLRATVALWSVGREAEMARYAAVGREPGRLAMDLADSLSQALFDPQAGLHASR